MTRWIIWPSVSWVFRSGPLPLSRALPPLDNWVRSRRHESVEVGDDNLGLAEVVLHVGRHELAAVVIAVGIVGLEDAETVL